MVQGILITILIYSLLLTLVFIYEDNSGYFMPSALDAVVAGPCMWILLLVLRLLRPLFKNKNQKEKPYVPKSKEYIEKTVNRIVGLYRKRKYAYDELFDFQWMTSSEYGDINGWQDLETKSAKHERINNKFRRLMLYQKDDAVSVLMQYFEPVPGGEVNWDYENRTFYRLADPTKATKEKGCVN